MQLNVDVEQKPSQYCKVSILQLEITENKTYAAKHIYCIVNF